MCGIDVSIILYFIYRYLDQSLLALDVDSDVTKNHMVPVIKQLSQHMSLLQQKLQEAPSGTDPGIMKQVKRLLMVSHHMYNEQQ